MAKLDCKTRILDAAESAIAEAGYEGASLRAIVARARVNLPTVYYYFRSKRGLLEAVFHRRFGPIHQQQLGLLTRFGEEAGGRPLPVEKVLEAMLLPPLRLAATAKTDTPTVMRLIGRIVTDPNPEMQALARHQIREVRTAVLAAMQQSLPKIPLADLCWRLECLWGAMGVVLCNPRRIEQETGGVFDPLKTSKVLEQLIGFFTAGLRAPTIA